MEKLKAPFPYFGGKSRIASEVWKRLGDCDSYAEPFFGSGAVLISRPHKIISQVETINDKDGMVSNFWRAIQSDPESVSRWAEWPVIENDLHARHIWLVNQKDSLTGKLEGDPNYYDVKIAGWWVWGMSTKMDPKFCWGEGKWNTENGEITNKKGSIGINRSIPHMTGSHGINKSVEFNLIECFKNLSIRLRKVKICSGGWERIMKPGILEMFGNTIGVFLDPPYSDPNRDSVYSEEDFMVAKDAYEWAIEYGKNKRYRIALCGYEGEHEFPEDWEELEWKAIGGYGNQGGSNENRHKERIWFSPHCLKVDAAEQLEINFDL